MKITQVELTYINDKMICWLPREKSFHLGSRVSLKDQSRIWEVTKIYSTQDHYEINRRWDVGGLS